MKIFTSITLNYLPKARILAKTLKSYHPDWSLDLLINDRSENLGSNAKSLLYDEQLFDEVIWLDQLEIPDKENWIFKHTIVELCTAVKGIYLQKLIDEGSQKIFYIDPDIVVFNELSPLVNLLNNHAILLTPHLLDYTDNKQSIQDNEIAGTLRHGTFNLGFLGVNAAKTEGRKFAEWWKRRLVDYCYADYDKGLFTDQKWCDLIPSFFTDYYIIRDPGYDVASWNLDCRSISIDKDGMLTINEEYPLRFYHFTGYDSGAGENAIEQLNKNKNNLIINEIWNWYHRQLIENGHNEIGDIQSAYSQFENGVYITEEMRRVYRNRPDLQSRFKQPFSISNRQIDFYSWWKSNDPLSEHVPSIIERSFDTKRSSDQSEHSDLTQAKVQIYDSLVKIEKEHRSKEYKELTDESINDIESLVKLIAFYLPQYHPIPENDEWWGKGFTEWSNVTKAVPQFPGHYQPHLPGELGFYDLRIKDVQYRQIELAKQFGIFGFAFYYYWFAGKTLLDLPITQFQENSDMDFPFCLVWANENWTRRWDGLENEVLISQIHTPEMDRDFIKDLEIYLQDDRYIRIKDRPVIIVYRLDSLPNPHRTVHIWRDYCINRHLGDPYLIAAQTFGFDDPKIVGFDAAVQFPPHNQFQDPLFRITSKIRKANPEYSSHIYSYSKIVDYVQENPRTPPYPLFKTAFPGWDNEPRRPGRGTVYAGSTPQLFKNWLRTIGEWTINHHPEDSRLVFINAWNEWAEGAHLEPDQKYGYAYLYATMNALKSLYIDKNT